MGHPHFEDNRVVWSDAWSGQYPPPQQGYSEEFDLQWKLALEGDPDWEAHPGASLADDAIADRVYEWTGVHPSGGGFRRGGHGVRLLDHPIDPALIKGRDCIDIGCGLGRWTRTLQMLGARSVLSVDMSASGLASVARFNPNVRKVDIMSIPQEQPDMVGRFDFAVFWGVVMFSHDPRQAFLNAASTVRDGGALYLMVYAPEGMHAQDNVLRQRRHFHSLTSVAQRLEYVEHVRSRRWDPVLSLAGNLRNQVRNLLRRPREGKMGLLDMLEPTYNWVIPYDVVLGWFRQAGFRRVVYLNEHEPNPCAYHMLGYNKELKAPT